MLSSRSVLRVTVNYCRALLEVLPDHWLSPDVGPILGCKGMLDFVLMPLRYGFELLREGRDLQAHQDRYFFPVAHLSYGRQEPCSHL